MDDSFVRIKRSFLHSDLWLNRDKKSIREAFVDILLSVNNEPKPVFINNKQFQCRKFQSLKSISTWADRWYVEKAKAYYYLKRLEKLKYIRIENMKYTTRITVLNAERFIYLGSDGYKESVNGLTTDENKKSPRITDSKQESFSNVVNGKKNNFSTKQVTKIAVKEKKSLENSSSLKSSLNELEKEKIMCDFFENEKKDFEKERKQISDREIILEQKMLNNVKSTSQRQPDEEQGSEIKKWNVPEFEDFFKNIFLPAKPVKLNQCTTIIDIDKFINSHLSIVKTHDGNLAYKPYLDRLVTLKGILTVNPKEKIPGRLIGDWE